MSLGSSMEISASGLTAERLRLDVISNNLANVNTTRGQNGESFRRREVVFKERQGGGAFASALASACGGTSAGCGQGVDVVAVQDDMTHPFKMVYDPSHPDADKVTGFVKMPNVEPVVEMVDMISATRAYEAGVTAINSAKQMQQRALDIGRA